jgi:hypothetical protein
MAVLAAITLLLVLLPAAIGLLFLPDLWYIFLALAAADAAFSWLILRYAIYFPQMRYELAPDGLHLRYGPLIDYHIPYDSIQRVWTHHFEYRPYVRRVSSPGLQLYGALYHGMGKVMMCATARQGPILLIKTDTHTYGITPQNEEGFIEALKARTGHRAKYGAPG